VENKLKRNILLVEDEILIGMLEKKQLENYGYSVHHEISGEKAIEIIRDETMQIDLILMDIDLGSGIDGTKTADLILQEKDIPIVFLSSHTEKELIEKTEKITSYGYVVKNSGITILDASIKMAFKLFKAYQKTREDELRYRLLIESLNEGILQINEDFIIIFINNRMPLMLGYTEEEMIGKSIFQFLSEEEKILANEKLELCRQGNHEQFEFKFIHKDGESIYAILEISPIIDSDRNFNGAIVGAMNVTERKIAEDLLRISGENLRVHQIELQMQNSELIDRQAELESLKLKYFNLYDIAPAGFFTLNEENLIIDTNLAGPELLGVPRKKILNQKFTSFINTNAQDLFYKYKKNTLASGKPQSCELKMKNTNGSDIPVFMISIAVYGADGSLTCRIIAFKCDSILNHPNLNGNLI
jgi:PAS domain S-box-containing protein